MRPSFSRATTSASILCLRGNSTLRYSTTGAQRRKRKSAGMASKKIVLSRLSYFTCLYSGAEAENFSFFVEVSEDGTRAELPLAGD